jgi:hypothetical protein
MTPRSKVFQKTLALMKVTGTQSDRVNSSSGRLGGGDIEIKL